MSNGTLAPALTVVPTAADLETEVRCAYDARDHIQATLMKIRDARHKVDADLAKWAIQELKPGPKADVAADSAVKRMKEAEAELTKLTDQEKALQAMEKRVSDRLDQLKRDQSDVVERELERRKADLEKRRETEKSDVTQIDKRLGELDRELKRLRERGGRADGKKKGTKGVKAKRAKVKAGKAKGRP